mgnify:CR=1 FL=1
MPGSIIIDNKTYIFKEKLKSEKDTYAYRCKIFKCRVPIKINKENLNKISDKSYKGKIEYIAKKPHKCKSEDAIKKETSEKFTTHKEELNKGKNIIMCNPLESLNFHKNKLENLSIFLKDSKINRLIYTLRNDMYPPDEEISRNINHITMIFDDKLPNSKNLPFCPIYNKFINPSKKNRLEAFIIINYFFLLKFLINTTHIFIDATFKIAPKNYY